MRTRQITYSCRCYLESDWNTIKPNRRCYRVLAAIIVIKNTDDVMSPWRSNIVYFSRSMFNLKSYGLKVEILIKQMVVKLRGLRLVTGVELGSPLSCVFSAMTWPDLDVVWCLVTTARRAVESVEGPPCPGTAPSPGPDQAASGSRGRHRWRELTTRGHVSLCKLDPN